ncbi:putative transposon Ty3-I Gag-Pol polyprotein [Apostichopus japonicus]|uniref:Putative transposon Ty3-I Gag-Pol polyprotein n=1 Tax=Stichopus japonicus TaxID=307972 RepID=A0A2G8JLA2_STIJA|nr:putative transposon Ty3-I Gag-Pol polyprotein [Apostichopus japonicus]
MIRSIDPSKRRQWPEMLNHLTFVYNATPHSATGISPFRMLYGRDPFTPLDQLLSKVRDDWQEDYIVAQAEALREAHEIAKKRMEKNLLNQKRAHDSLPMSKPFPVGARVLLKRCAFDGRHKLKDKFYHEPYVVVSINKEGDVYSIRPALGGDMKTVNRRLLIHDPRSDQPCLAEPDADIIENENEVPPEVDTDDDDENLCELLPLWLYQQEAVLPERGRPPVIDEEQPVSCRRSARVNKEVHSNPAHLPRSILPNAGDS